MSDIFSLVVVLGGSAIAIGLVVLLNVILGASGRRRFTHLEDALQQVRHAVIDFEPSGDSALIDNGSAVLSMETGGQGRVALGVWMGDRAVIRVFKPGELKSVLDNGACLSLKFSDYTFPEAQLTFDNVEMRSLWAERLRAFV